MLGIAMRRNYERWHRSGASFRVLATGFTMVELVTVMVVIGILGAIGASRFFDNNTFAGRAYSDQVKSVIRYAQKLAIAQNRPVFVLATPARVAVCFTANCNSAAALAFAPGSANTGSTATRAACTLNNNYVANWMCEGTPASVAVTGVAPGDVFSFDRMGRPSFAAPLTLTFTSGTSVYQFTVEAQTGYVH